MQAAVIGDLGVVETLEEVSCLHAVRVEAESRVSELAAHFADLHPGESVPASVVPGAERGVRLGGSGTPVVAEFGYAELGARMQMSTWSARRLVADALDVRHRLPLVWARVQAREARVGNARLVAAKTRHLSVQAAGCVDRAMVDHVDGSLPWGRFETRLDGVVVRADPATAAQREAARMAEQFAKRTRASEQGTAGFYVRSSVGVIARLDASVGFLAEALKAFGDTDDLDRRRVKAVLVLANPTRAVELLAAFAALRSRTAEVPFPVDEPEPEAEPEAEAEVPVAPDALSRMDAFARKVGFGPTRLPSALTGGLDKLDRPGGLDKLDRPGGLGRPGGLDKLDQPGALDRAAFRFDWSKLLPPVTLNLHLAAENLERNEGGVARWEGEGPVTLQYVHDHLRPLHSYRIQPVIDLAGQAPVDAYEIPDRHRRAVRLRSPADYFPFSANLDPRVDVDHTLPYAAGGPSRLENYGPLGRFHHRLKTHGRWSVRQPFPGIYLWRDPHGQIYLVDHTGTRKVTG